MAKKPTTRKRPSRPKKASKPKKTTGSTAYGGFKKPRRKKKKS